MASRCFGVIGNPLSLSSDILAEATTTLTPGSYAELVFHAVKKRAVFSLYNKITAL